jgi:AraC-like DNA-binding protein
MGTDILSPLLAHFSARARLFYSGNLCQSATFDEAAHVGFLHLLRSGSMRLRDASGHAATVTQPTLIFYSRPCTHTIDADPRQGADLACASVEFDHQLVNPIARALPLRFQCGLHELEESRRLLDLLFDEAFAQRPARADVLNRLFELVLINVLRTTIARGNNSAGFLRGLAHPKLSHALNAMHAHPEQAWSLEALAQRASMSRTSFAEVFRYEVGQTPGEYLTQWRVTTAQALLRRGTPLKLVAERVGYASQAGFLRAFKLSLGVSPKDWLRKTAAQPSALAQNG